ncbi:MAG: SpoIID/LytB domain-containing protein [Firmicutes bacterium]|nr:SpoIID/LytB domain-containing protein [Bacillota bacterium]
MINPGPKARIALILAAALMLLIICVWRLTATEEEEEGAAYPAGPVIAVLSREGEIFQMPLERFLTGVVAAEMPASFRAEALAAQAGAAGT